MQADSGWRIPPAKPYRAGELVLQVPADALEATILMLRAAGARESGLFWYGRRGEQVSTVSSVRAPKQRMMPYNYHVDAAAMTEMGASLADDLRPLAQVHSHPGGIVEHSPYDDEMASSRRALSLVFPHYGQVRGRWPEGIGIHEWQDGYWHLLPASLATTRVVLVPRANVERIDFR